jgi:hypothetical protein
MRYTTPFILIILLVAPFTWAQDAPAPDTEESAAESLVVTVISVEGTAECKDVDDEDDDAWRDMVAGEELDELTIIRTGFGAQVVLKFADRGEVTVKGATKCGIATFRPDEVNEEQVNTEVGIRYGYLEAHVDSTGGKENDFRVSTPIGTLAAKGSRSSVGVSNRGLGLSGQSGSWAVSTPFGNTNLGPGQKTDGQGTPSGQLANQQRGPFMGDMGQNPEELKNLLENGGGRGVFGFTGSFEDGITPGSNPSGSCPTPAPMPPPHPPTPRPDPNPDPNPEPGPGPEFPIDGPSEIARGE